MWLLTKNSFLSVVEHRDQANTLLVRARRKKDIERLFPKLAKQITIDNAADYKYRLIASKKDVAEVVTDYILHKLTYDNFKAAQDDDNPDWINFLHAVWHEGYKLQK